MLPSSPPAPRFKRYPKPTLSTETRKKITAEYAAAYKLRLATSDEETAEWLSVKLSRPLVNDFQDALGGFIQQEAHRLATTATADAMRVQAFLNENPLPQDLATHLPTEYRIYSLLMNTAKQFISREQAHTDSHVLGNGYKAWAKAAFGACLVTQQLLTDDVEWHHVLRDGRPPIPLTKAGHEQVDTSERHHALHNDPVYQVLGALKAQLAQQKRFYSWVQLHKECTDSSNRAWRRAVQEALQQAGLPHQKEAILAWLDKNKEFLKGTY